MRYFVIFLFTFGGGFVFSYGLSHSLIFCLFGGILFGFGMAMAIDNSQHNVE